MHLSQAAEFQSPHSDFLGGDPALGTLQPPRRAWLPGIAASFFLLGVSLSGGAIIAGQKETAPQKASAGQDQEAGRIKGSLEEALAAVEQAVGNAHLDYAQAAIKLADSYLQQHRYAKAESLLSTAAEIYKKSFGEQDPRYADVLMKLAAVSGNQNKYQQAEKLYLQASQIYNNVSKKNRRLYAQSLMHLGHVYVAQGNKSKGASFYKKSLEIQNTLGLQSPDIPREAMQALRNRGKNGQRSPSPALMVPARPAALPPTALGAGPDNADSVVSGDLSREEYGKDTENRFRRPTRDPLSTFSIDVDTASYAVTRRYLSQNNRLPPPNAVRIEEFVNYFPYNYDPPADQQEGQGERSAPFAARLEVASCPWNTQHRLVRVALKGREIAHDQRPSSNLVFLIDVSGSMRAANKLPLLKQAFRMLVEQLTQNDRVAIAVYAGAAGLVLDSTPGDQKDTINEALGRLNAGGSTNGGAGIELAYATAGKHFIKGGVNRVILATDGDFNVGTTSYGALQQLIEKKGKSGVFLSVLGFGQGNLKDKTMETLADKGNGNYGYIDTLLEARKLLVQQLSGTLITIAKDVKIQVEFNPSQVKAYRLLGYENRLLAAEDFHDDAKDAGEIGAGHTVTAFYEVIPADGQEKLTALDQLKYQRPLHTTQAAQSNELLTLKLKYKKPDAEKSEDALEFPLVDPGNSFDKASEDFQFAAAVVEFGLLLRNSQHKGQANYEAVKEIAAGNVGDDESGYRAEFLGLVQKAQWLSTQP